MQIKDIFIIMGIILLFLFAHAILKEEHKVRKFEIKQDSKILIITSSNFFMRKENNCLEYLDILTKEEGTICGNYSIKEIK